MRVFRPFSDVGLQTNFLSIQGHLLHLHTATFLSQIHPYAFVIFSAHLLSLFECFISKANHQLQSPSNVWQFGIQEVKKLDV